MTCLYPRMKGCLLKHPVGTPPKRTKRGAQHIPSERLVHILRALRPGNLSAKASSQAKRTCSGAGAHINNGSLPPARLAFSRPGGRAKCAPPALLRLFALGLNGIVIAKLNMCAAGAA